MKKILTAIVFLLFCTASVEASIILKPDNFQYCSELEQPAKNSTLYQTWITSDILQKCSTDCSDLRLFDQDNNEIPYVIIGNEHPDEIIETYRLEIVSYSDNPASKVITMKMPDKYRPVSLISLDISERDFKKTVMLYGSHNIKKWDLLVKEAIYDFSSQVALRKTEIKFNKADYRYYRLEIIDDNPSVKSDKSIKLKYEGLDFSADSLEIKNLHISKITGTTGFRKDNIKVYDENNFTTFTVNLDKDRNTVIFLEAGLPFDKIYFDISNPYYHREISLYGSNTGEKDSYKFLTRESIFSFPISDISETKNYIAYQSPKEKFYKIIIQNRNNPPLEIKSIKFLWVQKNLYFVSLNKPSNYSLCFGNNTISGPSYDLANFINHNNWFNQNYEKLNTAQIIQNSDFRERPPEDRKMKIEKIVLIGIVIILVIGIGFWLYRLMREAFKNPN